MARAPKRIFVSLSGSEIHVSSAGPSTVSPCHPLSRTISACYVAAVAISIVVGLEKQQDNMLIVPFEDFGVGAAILNRPIVLNDAVLVGAGSIGNGFLRALRHLRVSGSLIVADPKNVSAGNLNRCLYFDADSAGNKAEELCRNAKMDFPSLLLTPFPGTFHELVKREGRIRRVFVATDGRVPRRSLQQELPLEVIDASTTAADEVIVHSHKQPTNGACLACIYRHIPIEEGREKDIAAGLGVSLEDVRRGRIDSEAADRIASLHKGIVATQIVGTAYDSLFKALCAEQALLGASGEQVLAPFGFVSNLAGALMVIELARFDTTTHDDRTPNYFFTDPWRPPNRRARLRKAQVADCEFCSKPVRIRALNEVWKDVLSPDGNAA